MDIHPNFRTMILLVVFSAGIAATAFLVSQWNGVEMTIKWLGDNQIVLIVLTLLSTFVGGNVANDIFNKPAGLLAIKLNSNPIVASFTLLVCLAVVLICGISAYTTGEVDTIVMFAVAAIIGLLTS